MPFCIYRMRNLEGLEVKGQCWCISRNELSLSVREKGYYVTYYREITTKNSLFGKEKITLKELSFFCNNFSSLLSAGLNLIDIVSILGEEAKNKSVKKSLMDVKRFLYQGEELSVSMSRSSKLYPDLMVGMIKVGEESGKLDKVFSILAHYYENENKVREKIIKVMTYPCIVCVVSFLIIIFMINTIIPMMVEALQGISAKLPLATKEILNLSYFIKENSMSLMVTSVFLWAAFLYVKTLEGTKTAIDSFKVRNFLTGDLYIKLVSVRFSRTLGVLLESGLLIVRALEITLGVIDNKFVKKEVSRCIEAVRRGESVASSMEKISFIPRNLVTMARLGEETGSLDDMLIKVSNIIEEDLYTTIDKLTALIEPALIIGLSIIIGFMMIAVFMPMLNLIDNI